MKIRKITFENIHSLKGKHEIEFSKGVLSEAGLFLITGPTGSGKSTLLDIITLALYNRIPRINSTITHNVLEQDGGIMTRNAKDCFAEVEYSINGTVYRSHWSIERNRNNNLNSRKQELTDVLTGSIIDSGTSVPKKNEEIIGLSYDQFVKAMVLSQGQFSKLLKSTRDERNKLLEDITGAKVYREIGKAVFMKYSECKKARENQNLKLGEIILITEDEKADLEKELKQLELVSPATKKNYDSCKEKIDNRKNLISENKRLNKNLEEKEQFEKQLEDFKDKKHALIKHNQLVQYRDVLKGDKENRKALEETTNSINENIEHLKKATSSKQNVENEITNLIGKGCPEENLLPELESFRKKVVSFQETEKIANSNANVHKNSLEPILKELHLVIQQTPELTLSEIQTKQNIIKDVINNSGEKDLNALEDKIVKLREDIQTTSQLKNLFERFTEQKTTISNKKDEHRKGLELVVHHQANILNLNKEVKGLEAQVELLFHQDEERKKFQNLDEHRTKLIEGEACPLCGSKEHPYASTLPVFKDQTENLLASQRKLLESQKNLLVAETTLSKKQGETNENIEEEISGLEKKLNIYLHEVNTLCDKLKIKKIEDKVEIENKLNDLNTNLNNCVDSETAFKSEKLISQGLKLVKEWEKAINNFNKAKGEKEKLYKGLDIDNDVSTINSKLILIRVDIRNYNSKYRELQIKLEKETRAAKEFKKQLDAILEKEELESVNTLEELILDEKKAESIREKLNELEEKGTRIKTTFKLISESISKLKEKDDDKVSMETLEEIFKVSYDEWTNLEKKKGVINQKLTTDDESRERHKAGIKTLESLKNDEMLWRTMNNLIGDSNGKKFSNFVQDLTLEQLIGYANIRLKELSDRYVLDIPTADEADKNDSLKVFDTHMGDVRRSVNTLSGGETFMLSLAMAFALSDLAAKNVNIESIFIDEGFGTLDSDTLNQAISILEQMQNEGNKSIGIISHVEALKERITTQIKLEKSGAGYSSIRIE